MDGFGEDAGAGSARLSSPSDSSSPVMPMHLRRELLASLLALQGGSIRGRAVRWNEIAHLCGVTPATLSENLRQREVRKRAATLTAEGLRAAAVAAYRAHLLGMARRAADGDAESGRRLGDELGRLGLLGEVLTPSGIDTAGDAGAAAALGMREGSLFAGAQAAEDLRALLAGLGDEIGAG